MKSIWRLELTDTKNSEDGAGITSRTDYNDHLQMKLSDVGCDSVGGCSSDPQSSVNLSPKLSSIDNCFGELQCILTKQEVSVKTEPMEIEEASKSFLVESPLSRHSSDSYDNIVSVDDVESKIEISEIVLINSSETCAIKLERSVSTIALNESEVQSSTPDISSFRLCMGLWKQYSNQQDPRDDQVSSLRCSKCEFVSPSGAHLNQHFIVKHFSELYSCAVCSKLFVWKSAFRKHSWFHSYKDNVNKQWKCYKCDYTTDQYVNWMRHRRNKHSSLQCVDCNRKFRHRRQFHTHMLRNHFDKLKGVSYIHKCKVCGQTFSSFSILNIHMQKHNGIRPYSCRFCNYKCSVKSYVTNHETVKHIKPKTLNCSSCSMKFHDQKHLDDHKISHLIHQCNLCPFKASAWRAVLAHRYAVHGNKSPKPFQCNKCPASFCHKRSLKRHAELKCNKRSGTVPNNPLQCQKCLRIFSEESYLDKHQKQNCKRPKGDRNHSAEKKSRPDPIVYKCHACNEQFAKPKVLNRHLEFCVFNR